MTGYSDLAELVNPFGQLGPASKTYIRTEQSTGYTSCELLTLGDPDDESRGGIVIMRVDDDSSAITVKINRGVYQLEGGSIAIELSIEYVNVYTFDSNPKGSPGATQDEFSPQKRMNYSFDQNTTNATITMGGNIYKRIDYVYQSLLADKPSDWPTKFLRLYQLNIMSSHSKIEGFGGNGMFQYLGRTTLFEGIRFGTMNMRGKGFIKPETSYSYDNFSDLASMTLNGTLSNVSNWKGDGSMDGTVNFTVEGNTNRWNGEVYYGYVEITSTQASAGPYVVTVEGTPYDVVFNFANPGNFDFTTILDPDPANWTF